MIIKQSLCGTSRHTPGPGRQRGAMTIFAAVTLLSLLTLMLLYSSRIQQAEQRISANEYRQKLAFHAAESAADQVIEYILANSSRVLSGEVAALPDGSGGSRPGWFDPTGGVWAACPANAGSEHPCGGEIPAGNISKAYFYDDPTTTTTARFDTIPINIGMLPAESTARVSAVLCQVDFANPTGSCMSAPAVGDDISRASFVITVLAYGFADCADQTDINTCLVSASIALPLTNYRLARGAPPVPLTAKTTFPPTGTAEIVPNPNAGGIGVPVSVWANANEACSSGEALVGSGNWATCEFHEWYESDEIPVGMACENASSSCSASEAISYTVGTEDKIEAEQLR